MPAEWVSDHQGVSLSQGMWCSNSSGFVNVQVRDLGKGMMQYLLYSRLTADAHQVSAVSEDLARNYQELIQLWALGSVCDSK